MTKQFYDEPGSLVNSVVSLMHKDGRSPREFAHDLNMNYFWIYRLMKGKCTNPSANRVEYIYNELTGKVIELSSDVSPNKKPRPKKRRVKTVIITKK